MKLTDFGSLTPFHSISVVTRLEEVSWKARLRMGQKKTEWTERQRERGVPLLTNSQIHSVISVLPGAQKKTEWTERQRERGVPSLTNSQIHSVISVLPGAQKNRSGQKGKQKTEREWEKRGAPTLNNTQTDSVISVTGGALTSLAFPPGVSTQPLLSLSPSLSLSAFCNVSIDGFRPEWCISTIYCVWDTPFWSGTLDMFCNVTMVSLLHVHICV